MKLNTYYWNTSKVSSLAEYYIRKITHKGQFYFRAGNAGDIYNIDLIKYIYNIDSKCSRDKGNRLLLVGSVLNNIYEGDILCGIGHRGDKILTEKIDIIPSLKIYDSRGPMTSSVLEKNGADLSNLKFEYDPGLLIKEVYQLENINIETQNDAIFIPHFNDEYKYKKKYPKNIKHVCIDMSPKKLALEILKSKVVYTSSLHGIIFSHALGVPCVFVKPQSKEPLFKYQDYFLSVGIDFPKPLDSIHSMNFLSDRQTTLTKNINSDYFYFPSIDELQKANIIQDSNNI